MWLERTRDDLQGKTGMNLPHFSKSLLRLSEWGKLPTEEAQVTNSTNITIHHNPQANRRFVPWSYPLFLAWSKKHGKQQREEEWRKRGDWGGPHQFHNPLFIWSSLQIFVPLRRSKFCEQLGGRPPKAQTTFVVCVMLSPMLIWPFILISILNEQC